MYAFGEAADGSTMPSAELAIPHMHVLSVGVNHHIIVTVADVAVVDIHIGCPNGYAVGIVGFLSGGSCRRRLAYHHVVHRAMAALATLSNSDIHSRRILKAHVAHQETASTGKADEGGAVKLLLFHSFPLRGTLSIDDA